MTLGPPCFFSCVRFGVVRGIRGKVQDAELIATHMESFREIDVFLNDSVLKLSAVVKLRDGLSIKLAPERRTA